LLYEEPKLRQTYGAEYEAYCAQVPRWFPKSLGTSRIHVVVIALLGVGLAQAESRTVDPEIRMVVAKQKFCLGQPGFVSFEKQRPDTITLRLTVQLFYRNRGPRPLIVPEEDATLILSRTLADVTRRRNQFTIRFRPKRDSIVTAKEFDLSNPAPPFFLVARPGEEGEASFSEYIVMRVHDPSERRAESEWLGKKVFLQLELDHLPFPKRFSQNLAAKWGEYGDLWTGKVRTEPLELDIPVSPKFGDCSLEYRID
jgi:hypothetical protein